MSGKASRNKGATYERQVAKYITEQGYPTVRRIDNYHDRDDLISCLKWLSSECKNQEKMDLAGWVDQAIEQAGSLVPVVWHKRKGKADVAEHYVTMRTSDFMRIVVNIDRLEQRCSDYAERESDRPSEDGSVRQLRGEET